MQSIRVFIALAIVISQQLVSPSLASAVGGNTVFISEVMTASDTNSSQEFVELYNSSADELSLEGWSVEYKSSASTDTASNWSRKAYLHGTIPGSGFYLLAPKTFYADADSDWVSSMATSAGHIRLKDAQGVVVDKLGYGSGANAPESISAPGLDAGKSLERLPGSKNESAGNGVDTDNNWADFIMRTVPEPQNSLNTPEVFNSEIPAIQETTQSAQQYLALEITELFINPASPLSDAEDEFIELFNPNDQAVNLKGYQLKGGTNFNDSYTFGDVVLEPGAYLAVYSGESSIGLTNSGGAARLLDPSGNILDETAVYADAPDGLVWAKEGDAWQWSVQPTPSKVNSIISPPLATVTAKAKAKKSAIKASKPKATKTKKATVKKPKVAKKKSSPNIVQVAGAQLRPATWLIIGLVILTIGYAIYEFRHDIRNYYFRCRGYFATRRSDR